MKINHSKSRDFKDLKKRLYVISVSKKLKGNFITGYSHAFLTGDVIIYLVDMSDNKADIGNLVNLLKRFNPFENSRIINYKLVFLDEKEKEVFESYEEPKKAKCFETYGYKEFLELINGGIKNGK